MIHPLWHAQRGLPGSATLKAGQGVHDAAPPRLANDPAPHCRQTVAPCDAV